MKLLHIDSSALGENSVSRRLSGEIAGRLKALHPVTDVVYHDLGRELPPHLTDTVLAALSGSQVQSQVLQPEIDASRAYIEELISADIVVIGAPMYNFSISSPLKAWIDRVVIAGKTFRYGEHGPEGLLAPGRKAYVASTRGGVYDSTDLVWLDHQESYLKAVLSFIGLSNITFVRADGLSFGPQERADSIAGALTHIAALPA